MPTELSQRPTAVEPDRRDSPHVEPPRRGETDVALTHRDESATLRDAVEAALRPGTSMRLSPELEERYVADTWRGRNQGIRKWLLAVAAIDLMWIGIDAVTMPDHMLASLVLRGALVTGLCAGAALVLRRRQPSWVQGLSVAVPTVALILITGYLAGLVGGIHAERYNTAALFASFAATIVNAIAFPWTVAVAVVSVLLFVGFILMQATGSLATSIELIAMYPIAYLASLEARRLYERTYRRNVLLALRDELRVRDLAAANDRLTELSRTDPLTGVFNRRHFDAFFAAAWREAVARREWIGVLMIDVDHFKALNDAAGHAEGDRCLQEIARTIGMHVRGEGDPVARYGGEEFVVILPAADLEAALRVAERVRAGVENLGLPNPGHPGGGVVTVSIGLAAVQAEAGMAPQELLQAADIALYAAKATGRNYVCGHSGDDAMLLSVADAPGLAGSV